MFTFEESFTSKAKLKVIGVGGAGGNAVNRMVEEGLDHVEFIAINTDSQDLDRNKAQCRIQVGDRVTRGLGAGAKPETGRRAVEENKNDIMQKLDGSDMVFITAGMGGGTGTGGAPIVAQIAKEMGILTVAIVTKPFTYEGKVRMTNALSGIDEMRKHVDTIIVIPNQRLLTMIEKNTPMKEAFRRADDILYHATRGISDLINVNGLINIDFADVDTVMRSMGDALMGTGYASGENMARAAAEMAIKSPLLEDVNVKGARGVLINITGGDDLSLHDFSEISSFIHDEVGGDDTDTNIIVGAVTDPTMQGQIRVTLIATGFARDPQKTVFKPFEEENIARRVNYAPVSRQAGTPIKPVVRNVAEKAPQKKEHALPLFDLGPREPAQVKPVEPAEKSEEPETAEVEQLIAKVEQGMNVVDEQKKEAVAASVIEEKTRVVEAPRVEKESLYREVQKEIDIESRKAEGARDRIKRFNSIDDLISYEEFKNNVQNSCIKNIGERLGRTVKRDEFSLKTSIIAHEEDDYDVPTFLRQQHD